MLKWGIAVSRCIWLAGLAGCLLLTAGCTRSTTEAGSAGNAKLVEEGPAAMSQPGQVRAIGTIRALRAFSVQVPQIAGQSRLTLVKLVANGTTVKESDVLAEFDRTQQLDAARDAQAKYEDLSHQVRQKAAQNRSDAEKPGAQLKEAEADLARAEIQLRKGPILNEIDRLKNEARAEAARAHVASLKKSGHSRDMAEAAALRSLELQTERQKVALERARTNAEKLVLHARLAGMVALENIWRSGSVGNAQEGDQVYQGQTILRIFDPSQMEVETRVGEPEGAVLKPGITAQVYLDAYPDAVFRAHLVSSSPVATAALGSPIKNFTARFRLEAMDPRLLPDLSAAVVIQRDEVPSPKSQVPSPKSQVPGPRSQVLTKFLVVGGVPEWARSSNKLRRAERRRGDLGPGTRDRG
jgi:HlyD family secretion protein